MPSFPPETAFARLRAMSPSISAGVLTADLLSLGSELSLLERAGIGMVHVDVMDGCFTPSMTVGPPFVNAIRTPLLKDVHLMIDEPLEKLEPFVAAGADIITIHPEACTHPHRVLQRLGAMVNANDPARGIVRGVALDPGTPLEVIDPLFAELELVVLLAVNPGWGGQAFIPSTWDRIERVKQMIAGAGRDILLCVDGGVTRSNIGRFCSIGVDIVVAGSAVFDGKAAFENARALHSMLRGTPAGGVA
jgi:ribulose-phosphate 3-epimerase